MASTDELYQHLHLVSSGDKLPEQQSTQDLLPVDEMELRFHNIRIIEDFWQKNFAYLTQRPLSQYRPLNDFEISGFLGMDLAYLRFCTTNIDLLQTVLKSIQIIPSALKVFATKKLCNMKTATIEAADHGAADGKARRDEVYTQGRCVITGTTDPEVCHIISFAANSAEEVRDRWENGIRSISRLYMVETPTAQTSAFVETRLLSMFSSEVGVSDHHWNTISLSPTLRDWWRKAYFGLKCLDTRDVDSGDENQIMTLRIQFHWMVWREREVGQKPATPLGRTTESIQAAFRPYCGDRSPFDERPTGLSVESGDIFEVPVPRRHMEKMILAFSFQWALVKLLAVGGGVEALDDCPDHPEFLDEFWRFPSDTALMRDIQAFNAAMEAEERRGAAGDSE
ncbi:hypothetical protein F5144DRAFT_629589 [Chaetomium tenue]|uniref:Uncharacterized protein n=1 Tax=Chaetomium tenue TaxID=1854479 RepID=A0ACB7P8Y9_9PEZI|nr:hypothetical protein F5144DRAFT_629589 [Chaetomium globosum]